MRDSDFDQLISRGKQAIPTLIALLMTPDPPASFGYVISQQAGTPLEASLRALNRRMAAAALGELKAVEAVEALLAALHDRDWELRLEAIWALGEIGNARMEAVMPGRVIPELVRLLSSTDSVEVRSIAQAAAEGLQKMGHGELVHAFQGTLRGDPEHLQALRRMMNPLILEALVQVLDHPHLPIAVNAARALGESGAAEALPVLQARADKFTRPHMPVEEACTRALARLQARLGLPKASAASPPETRDLPRVSSVAHADIVSMPRTASEDEPETSCPKEAG